MPQNVLVIGGSRHIGYHSAIRWLGSGSTVTFLLRSPSVFDEDKNIQHYVQSKKARLVQGDALVEEDLKRVWSEASACAPVDVLLSTVGFTGTSSFHPLKGFTISPPNMVTQVIFNTLRTMPQTSPPPKVVVVTTSGVSRSSRADVPCLLIPLYTYLIGEPLKDKLGVERVITHCAGWEWNSKDGEPDEKILSKGWQEMEGLPPPGTLDAMVVRAALLTDGKCLADEVVGERRPYRAGPHVVGGWTISRRDVAHFIVDAVTNKWDQYRGQRVNIAY